MTPARRQSVLRPPAPVVQFRPVMRRDGSTSRNHHVRAADALTKQLLHQLRPRLQPKDQCRKAIELGAQAMVEAAPRRRTNTAPHKLRRQPLRRSQRLRCWQRGSWVRRWTAYCRVETPGCSACVARRCEPTWQACRWAAGRPTSMAQPSGAS